jgi:hypothetical protein
VKIKIVPIQQEHHSFVIANWLQQNLYNGFKPHPIKPIYYKEHQILIKNHLSGVVAINEEDEGQFIGFACGNSEVIHFIFTKEIFRGLGIARSMWKALGSPKVYSHVTKLTQKLIDKTFSYNPYAFYGGNHVKE